MREGRDGLPGPRGRQGKQGPQGRPGRDGSSAFEIARAKGFEGDEEAFLASLKGAQGERGVTGEVGPQGEPGPEGKAGVAGRNGIDGEPGRTGKAGTQGPRGPEGPEGPMGPIPRHLWEGTVLRWELPSGQFDAGVDLKGPPGKNGRDGFGGGGSSSSGGGTWGSITGTLSSQTDLQNALDAKAALASPALTGSPTAPTQTANDNSTKIATTAYVDALGALKAPLASPTFTGDPKAPTPTAGDNDTSIATTAFVQSALGALPGIIAADNSVVTVSGTSKTTVYSFTLPANALSTTKTARIEMSGEHQRSGTAGTLTIEVKLGNTVLFADTGASMTAVNSVLHAWFLSFDISAAAATNAQFCSGQFIMGPAAAAPTSGTAGDSATVPAAATGQVTPFTGTATEDQTTNLTVTVSVTMATSSTTLTFIKRKAIAYMLGSGPVGATGATGASGAGTNALGINTQAGSTYMLAASDDGKLLDFTFAGAVTVTLPTNAAVAISTGFNCLMRASGSGGSVTTAAAGGVTSNPEALTTRAQYAVIGVAKIATDTWFQGGDST